MTMGPVQAMGSFNGFPHRERNEHLLLLMRVKGYSLLQRVQPYGKVPPVHR
jgi:hypothetical protein